MIYVDHKITLDVRIIAAPVFVQLKKKDSARRILVYLTDRSLPYQIAEDCYAVFAATKPDRKIIFNNCTIEGNTIIYEITDQTTAAVGQFEAEIKLYGGDGKLITSPFFTIIVTDTVYDEGDGSESTSEYNALADLIAKAQKVKDGASAYEIAVQNGFEGTEEEWLASLKGETGDSPVRGVDYFTEEDKQAMVDDVLNTREITKMRGAIADIQAELAYEPIVITSFTKNVNSTYEIGTSLPSVVVEWKLNKIPVSQDINGTALEEDDRQHTIPGPFTSNETFTLTVTDEQGATDAESTSISFLNRIYYGTVADGTTIDAAAIKKLNSKLQSGRGVTFNVSGASSTSPVRIIYALPTTGYGTPTFKGSNGFEVDMYRMEEPIQVENALGYITPCYVWLSTYPQEQASTVIVS